MATLSANAAQLVGQTKVIEVKSDLTISLFMKNSPPVTVRLAGVAMPDEVCDSQDCIPALTASAHLDKIRPSLEKQLAGKEVRFESNGRTSRLKPQVTTYDAGADVAMAMLANGHTMWCPGIGSPAGKSKEVDYLRAEWEAIAAKRGIWSAGQSFTNPSHCKPIIAGDAKQ